MSNNPEQRRVAWKLGRVGMKRLPRLDLCNTGHHEGARTRDISRQLHLTRVLPKLSKSDDFAETEITDLKLGLRLGDRFYPLDMMHCPSGRQVGAIPSMSHALVGMTKRKNKKQPKKKENPLKQSGRYPGLV